MIDGKRYIEIVKTVFSFLIHEFSFILTKELENGNAFYDVEYRNDEIAISISYENVEEYLQVIVFRLKNGQLPDYDDKLNTLHLSELNKNLLNHIDKKEVEENDLLFHKFITEDVLERKLLKSAKDLRLNLKHWNRI